MLRMQHARYFASLREAALGYKQYVSKDILPTRYAKAMLTEITST